MNQPRVIFMGTPDFAVTMLKTLLTMDVKVVGVVTQPDRFVGRKKILTPPPVKELAQTAGIPVFQPVKIKQAESLATMAKWQGDLIVTAAYGQILPESLLASMPLGAYNVHASLLPRYRGGAPIQRAIMHEETETGVTLMTMVKAMDAGPMWSSCRVAISNTMTYGELHDELAKAGTVLLKETLPNILAGTISPIEQDHEQATYAPIITKQDERIDFSQTASQVCARLRALYPAPGAFTTLLGKRLKIWRGEVFEEGGEHGEVGQIIALQSEGPVITCQVGTLLATSLQWEGKTVQSGETFANTHRHLLYAKMDRIDQEVND